MKDNEQVHRDLGFLYPGDKERIRSITTQLDAVVKSASINEDNLRSIINAANELASFNETYILRLLQLYKQNHII